MDELLSQMLVPSSAIQVSQFLVFIGYESQCHVLLAIAVGTPVRVRCSTVCFCLPQAQNVLKLVKAQNSE